ncbi:MAG: Rieske (2Fe-2S) protein [Bacteroidetes bacterium]|nr:Rieske (2Fe-2S) protein [Bacteroidota bacterium]
MQRRKFLNTCVFGIFGISGVITFLESCSKINGTQSAQGPTVNFTLDLSDVTNFSLNKSGGLIVSNGVMVINSGGNFICLAQACTHQGCSLDYRSSTNNLVCPCHGGTFDLDGKVTSGPPPAPIKKYLVVKNGNILTISG